ncbi:hypothetical protein BGZ60DRAFT_15137 [Tricladium varicosporioides]|nr:hypothetical protein BGZ60DRAFT_15137 [Hymenoscyphus varicosporioides]
MQFTSLIARITVLQSMLWSSVIAHEDKDDHLRYGDGRYLDCAHNKCLYSILNIYHLPQASSFCSTYLSIPGHTSTTIETRSLTLINQATHPLTTVTLTSTLTSILTSTFTHSHTLSTPPAPTMLLAPREKEGYYSRAGDEPDSLHGHECDDARQISTACSCLVSSGVAVVITATTSVTFTLQRTTLDTITITRETNEVVSSTTAVTLYQP